MWGNGRMELMNINYESILLNNGKLQISTKNQIQTTDFRYSQIPSSLKLRKKSLHINLIYILRNKQLKHEITTKISVVFSMTFFKRCKQ